MVNINLNQNIYAGKTFCNSQWGNNLLVKLLSFNQTPLAPNNWITSIQYLTEYRIKSVYTQLSYGHPILYRNCGAICLVEIVL